MNKQFELLEFVFDSVYVDLQYDDISLTFTDGSVSLSLYPCTLCCGCGCCGDCDACTVVCEHVKVRG